MDTEIEKYLIEGSRPLVVIPELVVDLGIDAAIILQQLHWLLRDDKNGKVVNGKRWIYNTYEDWRKEYFSWMSERAIRRAFTLLETKKLIESDQFDRSSRRKYYRLLVGGTAK